MKKVVDNYKKIWHEDRKIFFSLVLMAGLGTGLAVFILISINFNSSLVRVSYSDLLSGYQNGQPRSLTLFAGMMLVLGLLHNLWIATTVKQGRRRVAKALIFVTFGLMMVTLQTFLRLNAGA